MRSEHRILTTHVGSLIRPPALLNLLSKRQQGERVDGARSSRVRASQAVSLWGAGPNPQR
jgi:methionine synthase II (cobalamin-independent)